MTKVAEKVTAIKIQAIREAGEYLSDTTPLEFAIAEVLMQIQQTADMSEYFGCDFIKLQEVFESVEGWYVSGLKLEKGSKTSSRLMLDVKLICLDPKF